MIPSLGRTVHYVLPRGHKHAGQHRAAIIAQVWKADPKSPVTPETPVALAVHLDPLNDPFEVFPLISVVNVVQDPTGTTAGTWHEPERAVIPRAEDTTSESASVASDKAEKTKKSDAVHA